MELSDSDIERLMKAGFRREEFTLVSDGVTQLRNVGGWCYFYNLADKRCQVYEKKPLGCHIYPVVYLQNEGVIVDELCPMRQTVSKRELRTKGKILIKLLKKIDTERKCK